MKNIKAKWIILFLAVVLFVQIPVSLLGAEVSEKNETAVIGNNTFFQTGEGLVKETSMKYAGIESMTFPKEFKFHTGGGSNHSWLCYVLNMPSNGKITNLSISNKSIATVKADSKGVLISPKKAGKATVKFTVKYGIKKKNFSAKLTIYKYVNPVSSYKFDGKEIKSKFDKTMRCSYTLKKDKKVKFNVKAKSGWKIMSFTYYDNEGKAKRYTTNSPQIVLKKGGGWVQINFTNKKTGLIENIVIWIK